MVLNVNLSEKENTYASMIKQPRPYFSKKAWKRKEKKRKEGQLKTQTLPKARERGEEEFICTRHIEEKKNKKIETHELSSWWIIVFT